MLVDNLTHLMRCAQAEQLPLLHYSCPDCCVSLLALQPPEDGEPWDSVVTCPHCLGMHFRLTSFDGEVEVWSLET